MTSDADTNLMPVIAAYRQCLQHRSGIITGNLTNAGLILSNVAGCVVLGVWESGDKSEGIGYAISLVGG